MEKELIDNKFLEILEEKVDYLKQHGNPLYDKTYSFDNLIVIGTFINNLKPKSKYRNYKLHILTYTDIISGNSNYTKKDIVRLVGMHIEDIHIFLMSKYDFRDRFLGLWFAIFILFIDLILILIGIGKFYYYIPVLTIFSLQNSICKYKKAKREGKIIKR